MRRLLLTLIAAAGLAGCSSYHDYGYGPEGYGPPPRDDRYGGDDRYAYVGDDWQASDDPNGRFDPWFYDTDEGREIVERTLGPGPYHPRAAARMNLRFRLFADTNHDFRITDEEVRLALVRCASQGWGRR